MRMGWHTRWKSCYLHSCISDLSDDRTEKHIRKILLRETGLKSNFFGMSDDEEGNAPIGKKNLEIPIRSNPSRASRRHFYALGGGVRWSFYFRKIYNVSSVRCLSAERTISRSVKNAIED